jgi:hypothetical protein
VFESLFCLHKFNCFMVIREGEGVEWSLGLEYRSHTIQEHGAAGCGDACL